MRRQRWVLATVLWGAVACAPEEVGDGVDLEGDVIVMATASDDYSAGGLAVASPDGLAVQDVTTIHGDAVVAVLDGVVHVVNRLGQDTVRRLDALDGQPPSWETSVGRGANPHAVARVGDRLLVTRYEEAEAWWLDPEDGERVGVLDLSGEADGDGIPEMSGLVVDGDAVLVGLQRLDRENGWTADPSGRVAVVAPDGSVPRVHTVGPNPSLVPHPDGGAVALCGDGLWRVRAEGEPVGPVATDDPIVSLSFAPDGSAVAILRRDDEHAVACLPGWDEVPTSTSAFLGVFLSDVLVDDGVAWVAARRGWEDPSIAGGLVRFAADDCAALPDADRWLRGTFAPYALAVRRGDDTP